MLSILNDFALLSVTILLPEELGITMPLDGETIVTSISPLVSHITSSVFHFIFFFFMIIHIFISFDINMY